MKIKLLLLLLGLSFLFSCQPRNASEKRLRQRANQYHELIIKGDFGSTWDFLWHGARRRRSWNEWMLFCQESELESKLIEFQINSISISKVKKHAFLAKVNLTGKNMLLKENKIEYVDGEDEWVFENGDWFRYID